MPVQRAWENPEAWVQKIFQGHLGNQIKIPKKTQQITESQNENQGHDGTHLPNFPNLLIYDYSRGDTIRKCKI